MNRQTRVFSNNRSLVRMSDDFRFPAEKGPFLERIPLYVSHSPEWGYLL